MTDDKDHGFKVADRRRYNPDGTPRESFVDEQPPFETTELADTGNAVEQNADQAGAAEATIAESSEEVAEDVANASPAGNSDNVVNFPGANQNSAPDEEKSDAPAPKPGAAKTTAASAVSATQAAAQQSQQAAQAAQQAAIENAYHQASVGATSRMPQASFLSLLNMLGVEAAMHLGLMEMQEGQRTPVDLEAARHMIDMIAMLKEKTNGNLATEEEALLENVLADLRMQYVALSRRA
jgi:hypothetical protein